MALMAGTTNEKAALIVLVESDSNWLLMDVVDRKYSLFKALFIHVRPFNALSLFFSRVQKVTRPHTKKSKKNLKEKVQYIACTMDRRTTVTSAISANLFILRMASGEWDGVLR